jgi:predicted ester cyclase
MTVLQEIAEGDLVTVLWTGSGTNTGEGNGLPATGKSGRLRGLTIWRIVNGKITEEWSAFDRLSMMQKLGLLPEAGK